MTTKCPRVTGLIRRSVGVLLSVASIGLFAAPAAAYGGFSDVPANAYYADAVAWMFDEGITTGSAPGCFSPDDTATRGETMTFLWRYEGKPGGYSHDFVDITKGYQNAPVAWGESVGITTGVGDGLFAPDVPVTRGDAVVFLWRLADGPTAGIPGHGFSDITKGYQDAAVSWARDEGITNGVSNSTFEPDRAVTRAEFSTFLWRFDGEPRVPNPALDVTCGTGGDTGGGGSASTVALGLSAANTGLIGGQNAGICSQNPTRYNGRVSITQGWLNANNGGSKTLQNFDISGSLVIEADNVTLRCGRVDGTWEYSVENRARGTSFEWFEANQNGSGKTILGGNYTAYRCNISGGEDGIHINRGAVTITECYIHDQNFVGDAHPDAIQATSAGSVQNVTVIRSKLISFYKAPNAALQINVASSWSITDSYLWGGVYSILGDPGNPGVVTNNYFGWDSSQYGAIGGVSTTRSGNVWWEWISPRCSGRYSASDCSTPTDFPGNGTPI
jgi:S-layer family protein